MGYFNEGKLCMKENYKEEIMSLISTFFSEEIDRVIWTINSM